MQLDWLDELMRSNFEVKILPRIGPPELGGVTSGKHLNCTICWSPAGFYWIPDAKHVDKIIEVVGLKRQSPSQHPLQQARLLEPAHETLMICFREMKRRASRQPLGRGCT